MSAAERGGSARARGATELRSLAEQEEDEAPQQADTAARNLWFGLDPDEVFSYQTMKMVRIKDCRLGVLYLFLVSCVVLYILVIVFYIEGKHSLQDTGIGTVVVRYRGKTISNGRVYDQADLRFPAIEPSGTFIMTKRITMMGQTVQSCVDMDFPARTCPCEEGEQCSADGYCETDSWCPSLGDRNALDPPEAARVERIDGLEHTKLTIMSGIAFPGIGNYFYRTGMSKGAVNPFKNITLGELLAMAQPPVEVSEIVDTGAVILLSLHWHCDVLGECEPEPEVRREDHGQGFVQKRARHRRVNGERFRDAYYIYGVRILVDSAGLGRQISFVMIIMQIGSGLALLSMASFLTDGLMLSNFYSPVRRTAYYACKVRETRDYSDLQDRINLIQDHREEMVHARAQGTLFGRSANGENGSDVLDRAASSQGRGGPDVVFGLGPGGRGGLPSTILRGRAPATEGS